MSSRGMSYERQWRSWGDRCYEKVGSMTVRSSRSEWNCFTRPIRFGWQWTPKMEDERSFSSGFNQKLFFSPQNLQRIRDLEDKTEIQRRQIKDLEEKVQSENAALSVHIKVTMRCSCLANNICCHSSIFLRPFSHHLCPFSPLTFHSFSFYSCSFLLPLSFGLKVCGVSCCEGEFSSDHSHCFSRLWSKKSSS